MFNVYYLCKNSCYLYRSINTYIGAPMCMITPMYECTLQTSEWSYIGAPMCEPSPSDGCQCKSFWGCRSADESVRFLNPEKMAHRQLQRKIASTFFWRISNLHFFCFTFPATDLKQNRLNIFSAVLNGKKKSTFWI